MAIDKLLRADSRSAIEEVLKPLHLKGCKITLGARTTLPPPSLRTALQLVLERRASSRILQPIAATRIQRAWARQLDARREAAEAKAALMAEQAVQAAERSRAASAIQAVTRQRAARRALMAQRRAQLCIAAAARAMAQRRAYRRRLEEISAPLALLQAAARRWAARRHLKAARAASRVIQSTWRRVRCVVLRARLARAANSLRQGGQLAKYRKRKGGKHERHRRFAWVSEDLQYFMWAPVADRFDEDAVKLRSIPMASITAVTEGVKTPLLKKMERRAAEPERLLSFSRKPLALDEGCAFSIICRERVVDFYAEDEAGRNAWLRDLKTALMYAHTYDHNAAMAAVEKLAAAPAKGSDHSDSDEEP